MKQIVCKNNETKTVALLKCLFFLPDTWIVSSFLTIFEYSFALLLSLFFFLLSFVLFLPYITFLHKSISVMGVKCGSIFGIFLWYFSSPSSFTLHLDVTLIYSYSWWSLSFIHLGIKKSIVFYVLYFFIQHKLNILFTFNFTNIKLVQVIHSSKALSSNFVNKKKW